MYIIGINAFHGDSSACIIKSGQLIAAVEEERFRRIKHWAGFPSESIKYCLIEAGISLSDVDHIAVNSDPKANIFKKIIFAIKNRPDFKLIIDRIKNKKARSSIEQELQNAFPGDEFKGKVHHIEHHLSHLGSAHLVSPYETSVTVSVDGFGDFSSAAWGVGNKNDIQVDHRVNFPHSLGIFYQALTQFLGFPHYGDEYKVMGLAPYGKPTYLEKLRNVVILKENGEFQLNLKYFRHHNEKVEYEWNGGSPSVGRLFATGELDELLNLPQRDPADELTQEHMNLAHSIQAMYEEAFFNLLNAAHKKYGINNLTLSGGCAMNSVANGKVYRRSKFKSVYIQSAAGDAGGAIGAAYIVGAKTGDLSQPHYMDHAYWGPGYSNEYIKSLLDSESQNIDPNNFIIEKLEDETELCARTARAIAEAKVIGWFQGRLEWGPRALGNRSIVCDPRRADMKDILNLKIKRRESFRPFAPSILREDVSDWFEEEDDVLFMMQVFQINEGKRKEIPAVAHVDGSGRLQTVLKSTNPRYYQLISEFKKITGVPIVLNTSFNENEPVVCKPEEALACFLRTQMDVLVLGNYYIERK